MTNAMLADFGNESIEESLNQYVTFFIGKERYAFPMSDVIEIIRVPGMVDVPLTSSALLGLANLRGHVLPVLDLRGILCLNAVEQTDSSRILVVNVGSNVGLMVDRVSRVIGVADQDIQNAQSIKSSIDAELLQGVIQSNDGQGFIQILLPKQCVEIQFQDIVADATQIGNLDNSATSITAHLADEDAEADLDMLVSFNVDEQEYAFHLESVQEIVRLPDDISKVPNVDSHVLGLINLRERILPLISLRSLFGMYDCDDHEDQRILVVDLSNSRHRSNCVGLVVDGVKEVLRVTTKDQGDVPKLLNTQNSDDIEKICRLENGKRLVSVLRPESLLHYPSVQRAFEETQQEEQLMDKSETHIELDSDTEQMVVFKLSDQEYGISIEDVQEITRIPDKLDKVPKTASFIDGMVNLRGTILPVVDMRTRFDMERTESTDRQRILVVTIDSIKTGFVVDSVSEVLRLSKRQIEDAPPLSDDQNRMLGKVVNLSQNNRIIQILSARELLNSDEQNIVAGQME